jgi:hypothetical protein
MSSSAGSWSIEEAGIHSGDSACRCRSLDRDTLVELETDGRWHWLDVRGLMNVQY